MPQHWVHRGTWLIVAPLVLFASLLVETNSSHQAARAQAPVSPGLTIDQVPYPRVYPNTGLMDNGWPFLGSTEKMGTCPGTGAACAFDSDCSGAKCSNASQTPNVTTAPINQSAVAAAARYPVIMLAPTPTTDIRPDLLAAFRAAAPNSFFIAYTNGGATWCPYADDRHEISYPAGAYYRDFYMAVTGGDSSCDYQGDRLLWLQGEGLDTRDSSVNINLAKRVADGQGGYTYPVADAIALVIFNHTIANRDFDAVFIDVFCDNFLWMENATYIYDYARAGYGTDNSNPENRAAFAAGWKAGHTEVGRKLRELAANAGVPHLPIIGNCGMGQTEDLSNFNGWTHENFPLQGGGTWYSNMFTDPGGMMFNTYRFLTPQLNVLSSIQQPYWTPYSLANLRKNRFVLASASLLSGTSLFFNATGSPYSSPNYLEWYDEFGVNVATGQADVTKTGWLGWPKGDMYQMISPPANPDLVPVGNFAGGLNSWTTFADPATGSTFTPETGAGPAGKDALRIHVTTNGSDDWKTMLASPSTPGSTFTMNAGTEYSATFWAKADHQRPIKVSTSTSSQSLPVTTEWRQYQVTLLSSTPQTNQRISFFFAGDTGDTWVSDIHVTQGVTSVYRRDFDNGIVLVNPSQYPQTVVLEKPYRKILGTTDSVTNDGSTATQVQLQGAASGGGTGDAIFLIDHDYTSPAAVTDLRTQP